MSFLDNSIFCSPAVFCSKVPLYLKFLVIRILVTRAALIVLVANSLRAL